MLDWALDRRALLGLGLGGAATALREHLGARRARAEIALPRDPRERHLGGLRQLTFGGQNAEAYFDWTGEQLVFQSTRSPFGCDQIFTMRADGTQVRLVSTSKGRTTCGYFFPDGRRLLYASTHVAGAECPPPPDRSRGYVWPLYDYDLFTCAPDGSALRRIVAHPGYDAEGAVAPDGRRIVFSSLRDGDLDLYLCDPDGANLTRLTDRPGYDGGPFFAWDGRQIVWRAWYPTDPAELAEYRALLGRGLVRPHRAELFVMSADGTGTRQATANGAANWAPFLHPDGERIIFASNLHDPGRFDFALYLIRRDGAGLERITYAESFAAFPMFSRDGRRLVFCSTRGAAAPREYNVFIGDWLD
ncbi:MAG: PD40 domain-containing protein [Candidatus Rokubacteria bacterium]|nr:PD40 domain-containing protein [Candidatus Rokubacteria bacterium]